MKSEEQRTWNTPLKRHVSVVTLMLQSLLLASWAWADPVIAPGQKPGVATSWSASKDKVLTLRLSSKYEPAEVADAIADEISGIRIKKGKNSLTIRGMDSAKLLRALERVEINASDEVDDMLAALQNPGADDADSGSSIRATQKTSLPPSTAPKGTSVVGRVTRVRRSKFPWVVLTVKVQELPSTASTSDLRPGQTIEVVPRVPRNRWSVNSADKMSKMNIGAWYAQSGDRVHLHLEPARKKDVWVAASFKRQ